MSKLPNLLQPPERPKNIASSAHWLAGEGAGSWFEIEYKDSMYAISRYSNSGSLECNGLFTCDDGFQIDQHFDITFPSHCAKVTLIQKNIKYTLVVSD